MKKILHTLTITILMFAFAVAVNATGTSQKVYQGYIILEDGQKLTGKIQMLSPTLNEVKVKFIDSKGKKITYKAKEVQEYGFTYSRYDRKSKDMVATDVVYVNKKVDYTAIPFGSKTALVERQENGKVALYNFFYETRMQGSTLQAVIYVEKGDKFQELTRKNYKKILKNLTNDAPTLSAKIGSSGYGFKHAAKIIKEYNNSINM